MATQCALGRLAGARAPARPQRRPAPASFAPRYATQRRRIEARAGSNGLLGLLQRWGGGGGGSTSSQGASPARQQLLSELRSAQPDKKLIWEACVALMEERVPFVESQLGGGPFHAVFTRGPLLWQLWTSQAKQGSRVTTASENQAWQDFDPAAKTVVNFGELLGSQVTVTASGSYRAADEEQQRCPKLVLASIQGGALNAWGLQIPLPIRGEGQVEVAYLDPDMRVFRATNGSISVQVRQDRLPELLGWGS